MNISLEYTKDILLNHGGLIALTHLVQKVPPKPFIDFARLEQGQPLLIPHRQIQLWRPNLPENEYPPQAVIALYRDHATCEQFHSEYKTDLDLERMPTDEFATNALVARLGQLAYNLLRILGQRIMKNPLYKLKRPQVRIRPHGSDPVRARDRPN